MATNRLKESAVTEAEQLQKGYDEAVDENEKPIIIINIEGKDIPLPAKKPAWIDLFIARYGRGKDKDVPTDKYLDFLMNLLGDDLVDYIIETADPDLDTEAFQERVVAKLMGAWIPKVEEKKN